MTELQAKILQILIWTHHFCQEHGLTYYMLGGTQLGAIRHKGFIPWDDDADIGMPRPDYNKFIALTRGKIFGKYCVKSPQDENYAWPYAKVFDMETTFVEKLIGQAAIGGLWLDVFPLDGTNRGMKEFVKYKYIQALKFCRGLRFSCEKDRPLWKNTVIRLCRFIPLSFWNRKINSIYSEADFNLSDKMGNLTGGEGWRHHQDKGVWGKPTLYEFEGYRFFGPERADEYLRAMYGDYMKIPPEDKRQEHAAWFVDLEHGPDDSLKLKEFLKENKKVKEFIARRN